MPFIRYTRDKRGYETTYVMHAYRSNQGPGRTRVLYFFRSPAHVRIGRSPLDEELREALEHTHPDLSFDWTALSREQAAPRFDERDHDRHRDRDRDRQRHGRSAPPAQPVPVPPPAVVIDDQTMLGRTLGAGHAARLRGRYAEILQRILRRSRTAEERDRLTEQTQRLNPDDWPDAEAITTAAQTIDANWDAVVAELPARRRGRRGGRRRQGERQEGAGQAGETGAPDGSAIMDGRGDTDAGAETETGGADFAADAPGDGDGLGADPDADGSAGDRLPIDDELRHD